ncbi:MAG TPA: FtsX-like permease family protein, partial [Vicinamibacterales bacterium]|nr:FtsX-like permease family protein [Vicinamibacterales bacterium]
RREIGIRMALGADAAGVLGLVVREGMTLATIGTMFGVAAAWALTRGISTLLFGVTATDPATFLLVPAGLALLALASSYIPARRATLVDPARALRAD